jgi:hypothetical protein
MDSSGAAAVAARFLKARFPPNCAVHGRRWLRPQYVDCVENPQNGCCPKNGFGAAFALLDAGRAHVQATELVRGRLQSDAGSLAENSRAASFASVIVIEPKIRLIFNSGGHFSLCKSLILFVWVENFAKL